MIRVPSTDGVELALHELGGPDGAPPLLLSHATGFHAHCYTPIATRLADRYHVSGLDYRGHGDSTIDAEWDVDWARFGDDAVAVAERVVDANTNIGDTGDGRRLVAFGHSMGGAALLMAAHRRPDLFDRLVLFEPISHEGSRPTLTRDEIRELPIVQGALRRRRRFESYEAAIENFGAKPPLSLMVPEALRNYVEHGFRPVPSGDGPPEIELRCPPEIEADIFVTGRDNGVWDLLPAVETPCLVIGGRIEQGQPSASTEAIADRLPNGRYLRLDHQTHFGPFSHPGEIADLIAAG